MTIYIKLGYLNNETVGHMLKTQNLIKFLKNFKALKGIFLIVYKNDYFNFPKNFKTEI